MKSNVRALREKLGLTQKELGQAVGVSRQAINAIETEKYDPSIQLAYHLARFFHLSMEEVFIFETEGAEDE